MLKEFYAVTKNSVYHMETLGEYRASAKKILNDTGEVGLGQDIAEGGMIAICRKLQAYVPEKYGMTNPLTGCERRIENVNTRYWGWGTSLIVGLFKTEAEALVCFNESGLEPCDKRWVDKTKQVLEEIGEDHPSFYICHFPGMELVTKEH